MVYLKAIQKIIPMDVSVSVTIDQKPYLKKVRGDLAPPWIRLCRHDIPVAFSTFNCTTALPTGLQPGFF